MENLIPAISGLIGAVIGASASVITMLIQSKIHDKGEKIKIIKELAIHDFEKSYEMGKATGRGFHVLPLVVYIHYHSKLIEVIEKNNLTPELAVKLYNESRKMA